MSAPPTTAAPPRTTEGLRLPRPVQRHERAYGLDGLDLKLLQHVKGSGGFFVEAGANDGVTQSNTALLARSRGWCGLLVEPVPELAARCRALRPDSTVVQAALVAPDHGAETVTMRYANLMSIVDGARGGAEADRFHVTEGERLQGVESYALQAPARTLDAILDEHRVEHVDLLSLDLEGYEPQALAGLDLRRHAPRFILVEVWDRSAIDALLGDRYDVLAQLTALDVLYVRRRAGRRLRLPRRQNGRSAAISLSSGASTSRAETSSSMSRGQAIATSGSS
jgi:FkbM family methyltransferase